VTVVHTLVTNKNIYIYIYIYIYTYIHKRNNTKHSKYKYTYYQNTQTYTHPHITKQVKTTTVQDTRQIKYVIKHILYMFIGLFFTESLNIPLIPGYGTY